MNLKNYLNESEFTVKSIHDRMGVAVVAELCVCLGWMSERATKIRERWIRTLCAKANKEVRVQIPRINVFYL